MITATLLGTVTGLAFMFFLVALLCSAIVEWWANLVRKRSKYLLRGLRDVLDTPTTSVTGTASRIGLNPQQWRADAAGERNSYRQALASGDSANPTTTHQRRTDPAQANDAIGSWTDEIMGHPLVRPFKQSRSSDGQTRNPSYLPARTFAAALIDILVPDKNGSTSCDELRAKLQQLPDTSPIKRPLLGLLNTAQDDITRFTNAVEQWYDDTMDRVSGSYKRWAKRWIIAVALVVAVALQVDTLQVGSSLYSQAPLRDAVVTAAANGTICPQGQDLTHTRDCVTAELNQLHTLDGLPVGWPQNQASDFGGWALKVLGWALTALAASLGAPFWFQALSKLGSLRNTGTPPARTEATS